MSGIDRGWSLQCTIRSHLRAVSRLAVSSFEVGARNFILGEPTFFAGLTDLGFLSDGLRHGCLLSIKMQGCLLHRLYLMKLVMSHLPQPLGMNPARSRYLLGRN